MAGKQHRYAVSVRWSGNTGAGTSSYRGYSRDHDISGGDKVPIAGSADPSFRGDPTRWNPEDLLVAALSACHKLWYLALCSQEEVVVTSYEDDAEGVMAEEDDGAGQFVSVTLHPRVKISSGSDQAIAIALHDRAHAMCFIARSVNFPVQTEPSVIQEHADSA